MAIESLYTAAQTRKLDQIAIEKYGIPGIDLMERAGMAIFDHAMCRFPDLASAMILCGPGNNGGDGYVAARLFHEQGLDVDVRSFGDPATPDAQTARRRFFDAGGQLAISENISFESAGLVIDAMLGSGLTRPPTGEFADIIHAVNASRCYVIAVDLPSGLCADTGTAFDPCMRANLTITFIGRKLGQYTADGPDFCGDLMFEDLGLEAPVYACVQPVAKLVSEPHIKPRIRNSHKGQFGHLIIAGGEPGMFGAVLLAGRGGLRGGAGLVTVLSLPEHTDWAPLVQPELMTRTYRTGMQGVNPFDSADAVVFGPGTTGNEWSQRLFEILSRYEVPSVLDAGALRLLAASPDVKDNRLLTPHPGEAAALLNCTTAEIQADRLAAAAAIQDRYGGVCVLKGTGTIIQCAAGTELCDRGNPGMASAGMGDVLSGIIGAHLAQGLSLWDAARQGVWWHAVSGDLAEKALGERSLIASDVISFMAAQ